MLDFKTMIFELAEKGYYPDWLIRAGIRRLLKKRLQQVMTDDNELNDLLYQEFINAMNRSPVAVAQNKANEQHYEVPAEFFSLVLGKHRKYSCCYWDSNNTSLEEAEAASLRITCERAQVGNDMDILELGCGWGSLSLWIAKQFPGSRITAVSNSHSQREYIEARARLNKLKNLEVITCDMNTFEAPRKYDRVISIEMFEHMRNYSELLGRISRWLKTDGKFLMHIFCHSSMPYTFEVSDHTDWMGKHFFTGGIMPSDALPKHFQEHMNCTRHWRWNGQHYARTLEAWLKNMDSQRPALDEILGHIYGFENRQRWWNRWRIFFMACAELFAYHHGQEWWVSHYLFENRVQQQGQDMDNYSEGMQAA